MAETNVETTGEQVLRLIVERGPINAVSLAKILVLTPAAVRRHISALTDSGLITAHEVPAIEPLRRGRPSRKYVATAAGQAELAEGNADIAKSALHFMRDYMGESGFEEFMSARSSEIEERYESIREDAEASVLERVMKLAEGLERDGFASTLRYGGPRGISIQLCQGHCPIQDVAQEFPELCEAETRAFARLLEVPIQRLSTLAGGAHVCTTNIPLKLLKATYNA